VTGWEIAGAVAVVWIVVAVFVVALLKIGRLSDDRIAAMLRKEHGRKGKGPQPRP
jgi:hypothetical protein